MIGIDAVDGIEKLGILCYYISNVHVVGGLEAGLNAQAYIMCRHDCYLSRQFPRMD